MLRTGLSASELLRLPGEDSPAWAIFDASWYVRSYAKACSSLSDTNTSAVMDFYLEIGQTQGHSPNRYFDETWYRNRYPDVVHGIQESRYLSAFDQYCRHGHRILAPHWLFNGEQFYRDQNPDLTVEALEQVGAANGYDHYLRFGAQAGRRAHSFFDPKFYQAQLDANSRSHSAHLGPFLHFLEQVESRTHEQRASEYFDPHWYLRRYPDVASAIRGGAWQCSLHHYLANDTPTKFDPLPGFSEAVYLRNYPDVAAAVFRGRFRNGFTHFIHVGAAEGRSAGTAGGPIFGVPNSSVGSEAVEVVEREAPLANPVPHTYQGTLDICTRLHLGGWAVDNGIPADLEVAVNDVPIGRIACGWRRPDLVRHGLPIEAGFEFVFDTPIAPADTVTVRFPGGPELTNSPTTPLSAETSAATRGEDEFLNYLVNFCGLQPGDAVLDVGCGPGRTALPLIDYLDGGGRYAGFDIASKAIAWCQENVSVSYPNFDFSTADVRRRTYNPCGTFEPSDFSFPYPDATFDVVLVISEFTRMLPAGVNRYLHEVARVLRPGGRSLATFFLLNEESIALSRSNKSHITFEHEEQGARISDINDPETAVAYPEALVRDLYSDCGLEIEGPVRYGSWCGRLDGMSGLDIVIAVNPAEPDARTCRTV